VGVTDLPSGRYRHPLRAVAFDTNDDLVGDTTAEVAREVSPVRSMGQKLPAVVRHFRSASDVSKCKRSVRLRDLRARNGGSQALSQRMIRPVCVVESH
jgi:hypothetical protein